MHFVSFCFFFFIFLQCLEFRVAGVSTGRWDMSHVEHLRHARPQKKKTTKIKEFPSDSTNFGVHFFFFFFCFPFRWCCRDADFYPFNFYCCVCSPTMTLMICIAKVSSLVCSYKRDTNKFAFRCDEMLTLRKAIGGLFFVDNAFVLNFIFRFFSPFFRFVHFVWAQHCNPLIAARCEEFNVCTVWWLRLAEVQSR